MGTQYFMLSFSFTFKLIYFDTTNQCSLSIKKCMRKEIAFTNQHLPSSYYEPGTLEETILKYFMVFTFNK